MKRKMTFHRDTVAPTPVTFGEKVPQLLRGEVARQNYITDDDFMWNVRNLSSVLDLLPDAPSTIILRAVFQRTLRSPNSRNRLAKLPREICCKEEVSGYRKREFCQGESYWPGPYPGERRWRKFRWSSQYHQRQPP